MDIPTLSLQQGQAPSCWEQLGNPSLDGIPPFSPHFQSRAIPIPLPAAAIPACSRGSAFQAGRGSHPGLQPVPAPIMTPLCRVWQSRNERPLSRGVGIRAEGWKQPPVLSQSRFFIYFSSPSGSYRNFPFPRRRCRARDSTGQPQMWFIWDFFAPCESASVNLRDVSRASKNNK